MYVMGGGWVAYDRHFGRHPTALLTLVSWHLQRGHPVGYLSIAWARNEAGGGITHFLQHEVNPCPVMSTDLMK